MELQIISPQEGGFVKEIQWNNEELKSEIKCKMQEYSNIVITPETIKDAKSDRAKLNKLKGAFESERKRIKSLCMEPYEKFEIQVKELISLIDEPISQIDRQLEDFEEQRKAKKRSEIEDVFSQIGFQDFVKLDEIFDKKWLNATVSISKIKEQMEELFHKVSKDVFAINQLPEFSFEALETYKKTLDVSKAIQKGHRLADIQKRKKEYEAKRKAEEEARKAAAEKAAAEKADVEEAKIQCVKGDTNIAERIESEGKKPGPEDIKSGQVKEPSAEKSVPREWVGFKAYLSIEDAKALNTFFKSRNIEFKPFKAE